MMISGESGYSYEEFKSEEQRGVPITFGSNLPEYQQLVKMHAGLKPDTKSLLVGSGSKTSVAEWQRFLQQLGVVNNEQIVIDLDIRPLKDAQELWRSGYQPEDIDQTFEREPPVVFVQADALGHLPVTDGSFDAVFTHLIGLNTDDLKTILGEAGRVLRNGGGLFIVEHALVFNGLSGRESHDFSTAEKTAVGVLGDMGFTYTKVFPTEGLSRREYMRITHRWTHETDSPLVDRKPSVRMAIYAKKV